VLYIDISSSMGLGNRAPSFVSFEVDGSNNATSSILSSYLNAFFPLDDLRGTTLNINALLWHFTNKNDLVVYMWNDQYRTPDPVAYQLREQAQEDSNAKKFVETIGRWGFVGMLASRHGQAIGKPFICR
jgi:hypothetical protein